MNRRNVLISLGGIGTLFVLVFSIYMYKLNFDTFLEFQICDSVSKGWVWDSTMKLQNREIRGFYQKDKGLIVYKFTNLKTGNYNLEISAPAYESVSFPVTINKGANRIEKPIEISGYEIPDFNQFLVFDKIINGNIVSEFRPVNNSGRAVVNHPCIDLWIGAWVSEQLKDGLYVQVTTEDDSERGRNLFNGEIKWQWDPNPETLFRYSSVIHESDISSHEAPYLVIDYLIIIPDSRQITKNEVDKIMEKLPSLNDKRVLTEYLDKYKDSFKYSIYTSWNVKGGIQ